MLAGGRLDFEAVISGADCRKSKTVLLAANILETEDFLTAEMEIDPSRCGAGDVTEFPTPGAEDLEGLENPQPLQPDSAGP